MRLMAGFALLLAGCKSATETIAHSAADIRTLAEASKQRFALLEVPAGEAEQERIISLSETIQRVVPNVKDAPSDLLGTLEILAIAAIGVALVVLVWQLGLGHLTKSLFSWVPSRKRAVAKLLDEAADPNTETDLREAIAALRAMDPEIDLAFRKQHAHSR